MKVLYGIEFEFYLNYEKICLNIVLMKVKYFVKFEFELKFNFLFVFVVKFFVVQIVDLFFVDIIFNIMFKFKEDVSFFIENDDFIK